MCATMAGQDKCIRDKGETMAKIIVNNENKKSTIAPEIYGHFQSISEDVSTRDYL